ncbi:head GIN domain-containing protein [uncultured Maribacter sp.]|uniref:head GIN domain-containing protein n=1 Tax=uncultured Maribacter sp. TaxID=431308 RepID=UPI00262F0A5D|nr:head GIN domain-containing protein [uncultured Maribacter sp.]
MQNQKRKHLPYLQLLSIVVILISLISCDHHIIKASDEIETKEYNFSNFTSIEIANDFNAYVHFTDAEESVEIEANSNIFKAIKIEQDGSKLIVKLKNFVTIHGKETLNVYISAKEIKKFKVSTDAKIELENTLVTDKASIEAFADGSFKGEVMVNDLTLKLTADSKADLFGTAKHVKAKLSADCELRDYDLEIEDLELNLLADSRAYLTVSNTIDIEAKAGSKFYYKGDAVITRERVNSGSKIIKKE